MEFTTIPNLPHKVSRIGLGTWAIGGWMWGGTDEKKSIAAIRKGLELGINFIDTAPVYGFGVAEELVGKALKQHGKRENIIVATKCGINWREGNLFRDSRKERIREEIENSLRRLQLDYIDLYQVHWPDHETPIAETAEELSKLLQEGKIKAIGVSNYSVEEMSDFHKRAPLHTLQSPFNLFERAIENKELAYALKRKIATLGYGPLCRGLLSGRMTSTTTFKPDDLRSFDPKFQKPHFTRYLDAGDKLKEWAQKKYQKTLLALALRWVLDKEVSIALWGVRNPDQLNPIDTVWNWKLTAEDLKEIDQILNQTLPRAINPNFMGPTERPSKAKAL